MHRHHVPRKRKRCAHIHGPFKTTIVVARLPRLTARLTEGQRLVLEYGGRCEFAIVERCCIHKRLKGRPRLTTRLPRWVVRAFEERIPPNKSHYLACLYIDGYRSPLGRRQQMHKSLRRIALTQRRWRICAHRPHGKHALRRKVLRPSLVFVGTQTALRHAL